MKTATSRAKIATSERYPATVNQGICVAPPETELVAEPFTGQLIPRGYRGWDHRNCTHTTPVPAGFRRCEGDNGCTILIRDTDEGRFCFMHGELTYDLSPADRTRPATSLVAKPGRFPWSGR